MKKLLALALAAALACSLCACGPSGGSGEASPTPPVQSQTPAASQTPDAPDVPDSEPSPLPVPSQPAPEPTPAAGALKSFSPDGLWYLWQAALLTFDGGTVTLDGGRGPDGIREGAFTYDPEAGKVTVTEDGGTVTAMTLSPTGQDGLFQVTENTVDGNPQAVHGLFLAGKSGEFTPEGEWVLYWADPSAGYRALDFSQRADRVLSVRMNADQTFYWPEYRYDQGADALYFAVDGAITAELALRRSPGADLATVDDYYGNGGYFALVPAQDQNSFRSDFEPEGTWSGSIEGVADAVVFRFNGDIPDVASIQYDGDLVEYNDKGVDRRDVYPCEYDADSGILTTYTASGSVRAAFYIARLDGELRLYTLEMGDEYDPLLVGTPSGRYYYASEGNYAVLTRPQ